MSPHKHTGLHPPKISRRTIIGLMGIFLSAIMAGLNNRVGALGLADVRGALGFGSDEASWLSTFYTLGELIATPFTPWFAITFTVRRFHFLMISICVVIAVLLPFVHDLHLLILLRFIQGMSSGALIPILIMLVMKTMPPHFRLYGLALYAMTATFAPNLASWLTGLWTDNLNDWRWVYWQVIPICILSGLLAGFGLPYEKIQMIRFKEANWFGMIIGIVALTLLGIALDQGVRLDWFNSPLITVSLVVGLLFLCIYLVTEWFHHVPFLKLQLLNRRNLWLGASVFICLLIVLSSGSQLPANYLMTSQDYRALQIGPIGLLVALPQLVLGSVVALFLYQKWIDARYVFATGLSLIVVACFSVAQVTTDWNRDQFVLAHILHAFGQPMTIVSLLFLMTSVVSPNEGPYFAGTINTLRILGSLIGSAAIGQFLAVRGRFHFEMLLDHAALARNAQPLDTSQLMNIVAQQSQVLSVADAYRVLGALAIILIPLVLRLTYIPAPDVTVAPILAGTPSPSSHG